MDFALRPDRIQFGEGPDGRAEVSTRAPSARIRTARDPAVRHSGHRGRHLHGSALGWSAASDHLERGKRQRHRTRRRSRTSLLGEQPAREDFAREPGWLGRDRSHHRPLLPRIDDVGSCEWKALLDEQLRSTDPTRQSGWDGHRDDPQWYRAAARDEAGCPHGEDLLGEPVDEQHPIRRVRAARSRPS
jgi:hypothetical protein